MELQIGEISGEISVDDLRLRIWEIIRPWNWGVTLDVTSDDPAIYDSRDASHHTNWDDLKRTSMAGFFRRTIFC